MGEPRVDTSFEALYDTINGVERVLGEARAANRRNDLPEARKKLLAAAETLTALANAYPRSRVGAVGDAGAHVHGDECIDDCNGCPCWCHIVVAPFQG